MPSPLRRILVTTTILIWYNKVTCAPSIVHLGVGSTALAHHHEALLADGGGTQLPARLRSKILLQVERQLGRVRDQAVLVGLGEPLAANNAWHAHPALHRGGVVPRVVELCRRLVRIVHIVVDGGGGESRLPLGAGARGDILLLLRLGLGRSRVEEGRGGAIVVII